ncbi:SepM family pheromone-processing serine protease [Allofustis seminis]|uniref:SepM family pheromone-processing serine protease n=1 Tax=Allofustis seminis TaxID=166939 RepID=UPI000365C224|nr:SepM family pheromone-processing serine protease [Allofustis seminis]
MEIKRAKRWLKWVLAAVGVVILGFYPLPYYIEQPGSLFALDEMVEIKGIESNPNFTMTTIEIVQASAFTAVGSFLSPFEDLLSENELFDGAEDFDSYDFIQFLYIQNAADTATRVAYEAAGAKYDINYNGSYIFEVAEESDFYQTLKPGDLVTAINDHTIENSEAFTTFIQQLDEKTPLEITYTRNDKTFVAKGKLTEMDGNFLVGVSLIDAVDLQTDPKIAIDFGDVGGPSGGLMYTLYIYNLLTGKNLDHGYKIAGTGTISLDGTVGAIGGAGKKVVAASEAGSDIFFVPRDEISKEVQEKYPDLISNYDEAKAAAEKIKTSMKIVPVDTFEEAVAYLENLK